MNSTARFTLTFFLSVCAFFMEPRVVAAADLESLAMESTISDGIAQIGKKPFPLPPGEWTLIARNIGRLSEGSRTVTAYLINIRDNKLRAGIFLGSNVLPIATESWNTNNTCNRTDIAYRDRFDGSPILPECLAVLHAIKLLQPSNNWLNAASLWVERNKIVVPETVLQVNYSKFTRGQYVVATIHVNPELSGQKAPSPQSSWSANDWHNDHIAADLSRQEYLNKVITWAKSVPPAYSAVLKESDQIPILTELP